MADQPHLLCGNTHFRVEVTDADRSILFTIVVLALDTVFSR